MNKKASKVVKPGAQQVYEALRRMIGDLELAPGIKVTETQLATYFEVSRTPIREALLRLENERLVTIKPKQGCFIRPIDMLRISDFYDVRVTLELMSVELAYEHMDHKALKKLAELWNPDTKPMGMDATDALKQAEEVFHISLAEGTRNSGLVHYLKDVNDQIRVVRQLGFPDAKSVKETYAEHYEICQALLSKDLVHAKNTMKDHIAKSQEQANKITLMQIFEKRKNKRLEEIIQS